MQKKTTSRITYAEALGIISGLLCIAGAFLPWLVKSYFFSPEGTVYTGGIERYGLYTLVLAVIAIILLIIGMRRTDKKITNIGIILLGLLIISIAAVDGYDITGLVKGEANMSADIGIGLYLTAVTGIGLILSGIWNFKIK